MLRGLFVVLLPFLSYGFNVTFPVGFEKGEELIFVLFPGQNPTKVLRSFCGKNDILAHLCTEIGSYLINELRSSNSTEVDVSLCSYHDDIILRTTGCVESSLVWGSTRLYIDLSQLSMSSAISAELILPAFVFNVDTQLRDFCVEHKLRGIFCRQLTYEVYAYLTSLYERPEGVTLANMFADMYYNEDLTYLETFVDYRPHGSDVVERYFFAQNPSHFVEGVGVFCTKRQFTRATCTKFAEHIGSLVQPFYGQDGGEMWCHLYIMRAVQTIVENHKQLRLNNPVEGTTDTADYVDADFVEIGTSNFNTLTQLVDDSDGLVGFAVEPSAHYLLSLPDKTGVTKVNCAIVSVADTANSSTEQQYVQLYHVPEHVIEERGLQSFLKGCNSVGRYHPYHVAFNIQQHVQIDTVPAFTVEQFLARHRIRRIRLLKIDAEGYDVVIMEELYQYLLAQHDTLLYPERIVFETNENSQTHIVDDLVHKYKGLGYKLKLIGSDTILENIQ